MSSEAGNSCSSTDREYIVSPSSIVFNKEGHPLTTMLNGGDGENPLESNDGREEEGDGFSTKMEDSEVRMDLTDDLLHMVSTGL